MPAVCLYFQVHQPHRLRRYSVFDTDERYFDEAKNAEILRKVAEKCYRPATRLLLEMAKKHAGAFRVAFSLSGTALEQLEAFAPDVLDLFRSLAATGCVEFLGETYYHSLASLYPPEDLGTPAREARAEVASEFHEQVGMHRRKIQDLFGVTPSVFRNTELIYSNAIAARVAAMREGDGAAWFVGQLCEGTEGHLAGRSPNHVYAPSTSVPLGAGGAKGGGKPASTFGLLPKNYRLSDDIAFRFSNRSWEGWPLTAAKFAAALSKGDADAEVVNLFMDYETFGEHQWADTGIFEFLAGLPRAILDADPKRNRFVTPGQALREFAARGVLDVPTASSWADTERDTSAWRGNAMQQNALKELYALEGAIKRGVAEAEGRGEAAGAARARALLTDWRRLTTSDHAYYMSTKWFADGDVHQYFSPYESPYDSYINFMNVLDGVIGRAQRLGVGAPR